MTHPTTESKTEWAMNSLKLTLQTHMNQHGIYEKIIEMLPMVFKFINPFRNAAFRPLNDVKIFMTSFLRIANDQKWSTRLTVKIISVMRYIAQVRHFSYHSTSKFAQ